MNRRANRVALRILLFSATGLCTAAQPRPDFSGTWVMNLEESEWPKGGARSDGSSRESQPSTLTISQTENELTAVFTGSEGPGNTREQVLKPGAGPQQTSTFEADVTMEANWEGDKLIVKRVQVSENARGETIRTSHRSEIELSSDGRKLIRRTQTKTSRGTSFTKIIYDRR